VVVDDGAQPDGKQVEEKKPQTHNDIYCVHGFCVFFETPEVSFFKLGLSPITG
jgi:hypothetical protein